SGPRRVRPAAPTAASYVENAGKPGRVAEAGPAITGMTPQLSCIFDTRRRVPPGAAGGGGRPGGERRGARMPQSAREVAQTPAALVGLAGLEPDEVVARVEGVGRSRHRLDRDRGAETAAAREDRRREHLQVTPVVLLPDLEARAVGGRESSGDVAVGPEPAERGVE